MVRKNNSSCGENADGYNLESTTCTEGQNLGFRFPGFPQFDGPNDQGPNDIIPLDHFEGTWRHVVATSDATQAHADGGPRTLIYIDGVEINGQDARIESTDNVPQVLSAGGSDDTESTHWIATIDELRIYDHYLSAEEIAANFQASPVMPEPATLGLLGLGRLFDVEDQARSMR